MNKTTEKGTIRFADQKDLEQVDRLELNMWEFNEDALEFHESVGFTTYLRYMEMPL